MIYTDIPSWIRINNGLSNSDIPEPDKKKQVFVSVINYLITDNDGMTYIFDDINSASDEMGIPVPVLHAAASRMNTTEYGDYKIKIRAEDRIAHVKNGIATLVQGALFA